MTSESYNNKYNSVKSNGNGEDCISLQHPQNELT
jgi:hypothetical protein